MVNSSQALAPTSNILAFVRHYIPGYRHGGQIRTLANLVERLGDEFRFHIVTSDRDATDRAPYPNIVAGDWMDIGKARVLYLSPAQKSIWKIMQILRETPHDVLYLNSFFDPDFTQKPLLLRRLGLAPKFRCLVAPRGEFSQDALQIRKAKKQAFFCASDALTLHRSVEWQASSEYEEADIRRTLSTNVGHIWVAPNLPDMTPRELAPFVPRAEGEPLRVCFLSRISPIKNLHYALDILARVTKPVIFTIYGPCGDADYWKLCAAQIANLPPHVSVVVAGSVKPAHVVKELSRHELFFLPTRAENYGHVIAEALSAGLRLLISNRTPWRGLEADGVGFDLPLEDATAFVRTIEAESMKSDDEQRRTISRKYLEMTLRVGERVSLNKKMLSGLY